MLMRRITRSMDKEFLYLKRHLSPEQAKEVLDLKLPGVNVQREYRRYYPASEVTGHLIGFTDIDDEGQEGLELAFNHWLAGESGAKRVLKDRLGRSIENVASIAVSCLSHAQSRNQDAQCPFGFDRRARRQDRRSAGDGQPAHLQPE
jgi:cell division protein FtsI/penicillin-binding protein 2